MKKLFGLIFKLIILVIIIAGIGTGVFYWNGMQIEKNFAPNITKILKESSSTITLSKNTPITFKLIKYNRGIFFSTAESEILIKKDNGISPQQFLNDNTQDVVIKLKHKILHGPFPFKGIENISSIKPAAAIIITESDNILGQLNSKEVKIEQKPKLTAETIIKFNEIGSTSIKVSAAKISNPSKDESISWSGLLGNIETNFKTCEIASNISAGGISLNGERGNNILVDGIKISSEGYFDTEKFRKGKTNISFKKAVVNATEEPFKLNAENITISYLNSLSAGDLLSANFKFNADKIDIDGKTLIEQTKTSLTAEKIDSLVIKEMFNKLPESNDPSIIESHLSSPQFQMSAIPNAMKLLKKSPAIKTSFSTNIISSSEMGATTKDKISSEVNISFTSPKSEQAMNNVFAALNLLDIEINLSLPRALLIEKSLPVVQEMLLPVNEMNPETITPEFINSRIDLLAAQKYLAINGDNIEIKAEMKGGNLKINGIPKSPLEIMALGEQLKPEIKTAPPANNDTKK